MKKMKQWVLYLLITPLIFTACQKKEKEISTLVNLIPKEAKFVLAFDNEQLIKKGGFDKLSQYKFYQDIVASLEGNEQKDLILDILNNPKKRGVNIDQAYLFMEMQNEELRIVYLTAMKDQGLFEQNILKLSELPAEHIQDNSSYKILVLDEACLVWNDKLLFLFAGEIENVNYDRYLNLPAEESLITLADFNEFAQRLSDVGLWLPMQMYFDLNEKIIKQSGFDMNIPMLEDMDGVNMHAYLHFNDDEIKTEVFMTPKEKMDAFYAKYPIFKWESDQNMLKDFPETAYFAFKIAMNLPEYLKILKQVTSDMSLPKDEMALISDMLEDPTVNSVLNVLGGDIIFSLYGFGDGPMPMPLLGLSLTVNSESDFQKLLAEIPSGMLQEKGGYYEMDLDMATGYIACKDNRVFITADEKSLATFMGGGNSKNITNNATIGKAMANSPTLFYINMNLDDYPKMIRDLAGMGLVDDSAMKVMGTFKSFSMYMNSKYNVQASLKFSSSKDNSLKQLIKLGDSF